MMEPIPPIRDLTVAGALAVVGAAACTLGLAVVVDTSRSDADVWEAILLLGAVLAVLSAGLVIVAFRRRSTALRTLSASGFDLENEVQQLDERFADRGRVLELAKRGKVLRRLAWEAGARRQADELSGLLRHLDGVIREIEAREHGSPSPRAEPR